MTVSSKRSFQLSRAWTKQDAHKTNAGILSKRSGSSKAISYYLYDAGSQTGFKVSDTGTNSVVSASLVTPAADGTSLAVATANKFTGATSGQNVTFTLVSHGGQAGTRAQTTTLTVRLVS